MKFIQTLLFLTCLLTFKDKPFLSFVVASTVLYLNHAAIKRFYQSLKREIKAQS